MTAPELLTQTAGTHVLLRSSFCGFDEWLKRRPDAHVFTATI
jgi:hypothetical protein